MNFESQFDSITSFRLDRRKIYEASIKNLHVNREIQEFYRILLAIKKIEADAPRRLSIHVDQGVHQESGGSILRVFYP